MIYYTGRPRLAIEADIPRIQAILSDPSVQGGFGPLSVDGKPWDEAFNQLAWFIAPGIVMAAEIRNDCSAWVHVAALPWARGRAVSEAAQFVIATLFEGGVKRIAGYTPANLRAACHFNRTLGFKARREIKGKILFALTREDWKAVQA